ncbi:MAG: hypothetical protein ACFFDN_02635 [Candidatus Hodarchaeota archaeon]
MKKEYNYVRKYISSDGEILTYNQKIKNEIKDTELHSYITDVTKSANNRVKEIKRLENLIKVVLQYRGYNNKNKLQRFYRLEKADEITLEEKQIVDKIMNRQKIIADDLVSLLKFILQLYESYDAEIVQLTKELEEFEKK